MKTISPPDDRRTIKVHNGKLYTWPGSVARWVERDDNDEPAVLRAPGFGFVPRGVLTWGTAQRVIAGMPANYAAGINDGAPVVLRLNQLSEIARALV